MSKTLSSMLALCVLALVAAAAASTNDSSARAAILNQEARWIRAAAKGDAATLSGILAEEFVHVNYQGKLENKAAMLARIRSGGGSPYVERTTDHTIVFDGPTAIVHGINSIEQHGRVLFRLRYTDVYVNQNGAWRAVSAQETPIVSRP